MANTEPIRGWPQGLKLGVESTWGTSVARTVTLPVITNGIKATRKTENIPFMAGTGATQLAHVAAGAIYTEQDAGGDVTTWLRYGCQGYAMALAALMGAAPSTSGAGPYVHTFSLGAAGALFLTGESVHGVHSSLTTGEVFPGLMITSHELSWSGRGAVGAKFGTIAQKSSGASAAGTLAISSAQTACGHHLGVLAWNSLSLQPKSGTLMIDRSLVRRPTASTGRFTDVPVPGGPTIATLKVKLDWTTHALVTAIEAATQSDAVLTFTGASPDIAEFTLDAAQITELTVDDGAGHSREIDITLQGFFVDSTNRGVKAVLTNANSAAY